MGAIIVSLLFCIYCSHMQDDAVVFIAVWGFAVWVWGLLFFFVSQQIPIIYPLQFEFVFKAIHHLL